MGLSELRKTMDTSRFLHKNLIISAIAALTIASTGFYYNSAQNIDPKQEGADTATIERGGITKNDDITLRDSDKDGLPDWEERLNQSDPFTADTDGDGTEDGAEIREGRDPTKAGPNDKVVAPKGVGFATSSTDLLGIKKEFFAKYLASASRDVRETTFRDLIKGFDKRKFISTNEILDLNISSDESPEALRAYGNAFGVIIKKYTGRTTQNEEVVLAEGMKTRSDESLKGLQLIAVDYRNFSRDLRALLVPRPLAPAHLKIVNGYDGMYRGLLGMQYLFSNPVEGAAGYQTYTKMRIEMIAGYADVVMYLREKNIAFTIYEPGYPFYLGSESRQ